MNKLKKIKFFPNLVFSTRKFRRILKIKDDKYITKDESIKLTIQMPDIKNRIKFILSLLCDFSTEVSIRFCDCEEMLAMNSQFRGKYYPTDVLSFPAQASEPHSELCYLGDILICLPVCFNQAKHARNTFSDELERMIIHGIVHLKGFDHERNESAWRVMSLLEKSIKKEIINQMGNPDWCQAYFIK